MHQTFKKYSLFILWLTCACLHLQAQDESVIKLVDPFIGTTKTKINSKWGGEGGTYPGAVAPFGFVQLTPETSIKEPKGYDFRDSTIFWFSCVNHMSGYPNGSAGRIKVMPVLEGRNIQTGNYNRTFSHKDEKAEAGYYSVQFGDNGTIVEVTASAHTGVFRFTFPPKIKPKIFLGNLGEIEAAGKRIIKGTRLNTIISVNADIINKEDINGDCVLTFPASSQGKNILILKIGVSQVDFNSTQINLQTEADNWDFDQFKETNQQKWTDALSVIEIEDTSTVNKTIFYTALYHSMLIPWIISDVDGMYKGADGKINKTKGKNQYGAFSPWDTFRSLHPLICLVVPDRQNDMILSMLDHFEQTGKLPKGPMTGNHIIPIIVDSYLKGIRGFDCTLAYKAMKECLESPSEDFSAYKEFGYVPSSYPESVTQTVEFAYNDWALAQFAGEVMKDQTEYEKLIKRSFNYRNLFHPETLSLLPRMDDKFNLKPGNIGYKEGDQWSYSMFIPHNTRDLINLMGGDNEFTAHLDSALAKEYIVFDNEPVLHVPYLFNYAHHPDQSQKWVRTLMNTHYSATPDGLPGNDDLGSMSSWYVFSALGVFPTCPGRPLYDIGSPIFKKVTLHLQNGKKLIINSVNNSNENYFVKNISLNGLAYKKSWISHSTLLEGGELTFTMDKFPAIADSTDSLFVALSETTKSSDFLISDAHSSRSQVAPDQPFFVRFNVNNKGGRGTKLIRLYIDGKEAIRKNLLIDENSTENDSIECRLYPVGKRSVRIDKLNELEIEVVPPVKRRISDIEITELKSRDVYKKDKPLNFSYILQNKGGFRETTTISVLTDDSVYQKEVITVSPGETKQINSQVVFTSAGIHKLSVGSKMKRIKIYSDNIDSRVIDFNATESQDNLEEKITVMAWVKPTGQNKGLTDIISKGDFIVMQAENKSLSFFAGGWGRGICTVDLPENWVNNWHHLAGVSDGYLLKIFIDGVESGKLMINTPVNLSTPTKWMTGQNEEFPGQRIFNGMIDHFKIFVEPLNGSEIKKEMMNGRPETEDKKHK